MISKKMVMQVKKCSDYGRAFEDRECEDPYDVDELLKHVALETWVMAEKSDFDIYGKLPVSYEMTF